MQVKDQVNRDLERLRADGKAKSGLAADVTLYVDEDLAAQLSRLGDELRFVLITSTAELATMDKAGESAVETEMPQLKLWLRPSEAAKCVRCWHHRDDVGSNADHPELCERCVDNVEGEGEQRRIA